MVAFTRFRWALVANVLMATIVNGLDPSTPDSPISPVFCEVVNGTETQCLISILDSPVGFNFLSIQQAAQYFAANCLGINSTEFAVTINGLASVAAGNTYSAYGLLTAVGMQAINDQPLPPYPPQPPYPPAISPPPPPTLYIGGVIGITIGIIVFAVIVTALIVYFACRRRVGFLGLARQYQGPPGPGPDTTLVVSDIMDSTILWELLEPEVMNTALGIHHQCIRKLLSKHNGYEFATEGDSFLLSFYSPADALSFSLELQKTLMEQDWGENILSYVKCAPKYACPTDFAKICKGGLFEGSFGLVEQWPSSTTPTGRVASVSAGDGQETMQESASGSLEVDARQFSNLRREKQAQATKDLKRIWSKMGSPNFNISKKNEPSLKTHATGGTPRAVPEEMEQEPEQELDAGLVIMTYMRTMRWGETARTGASSHHQNVAGPSGASISVLEYLQKAWRLISEADLETGPLTEDPFCPIAQSPTAARHGDVRKVSFPKGLSDGPFPRAGNRTMGKEDSGNVLVFKGIRLRLGLHTGVSEEDFQLKNSTTGRSAFTGAALAMAKAVGDSGPGGSIMISQSCFERLQVTGLMGSASSSSSPRPLILNMGNFQLKDETLPPQPLYQVISKDMVQRLPFFEPLRVQASTQLGIMDAPLGQVTVAFCNLVGAGTLLAWDRGLATEAIQTFGALAIKLLNEARGYLVELTSSGLCLATFSRPLDALMWGLCLTEAAKLEEWNPAILEHELCEEVMVRDLPPTPPPPPFPSRPPTPRQATATVGFASNAADSPDGWGAGGAGGSSGGVVEVDKVSRLAIASKVPKDEEKEKEGEDNTDSPSLEGSAGKLKSSHSSLHNLRRRFSFRYAPSVSTSAVDAATISRLLFRGPRLKIGLDIGLVAAEISPATGRVTYRGKVMNRSARIASKAASGAVWCSQAAWNLAEIQSSGDMRSLGLTGEPLGPFALKGVAEEIQLMQCSFGVPQTVLRSNSMVSSRNRRMSAAHSLRDSVVNRDSDGNHHQSAQSSSSYRISPMSGNSAALMKGVGSVSSGNHTFRQIRMLPPLQVPSSQRADGSPDESDPASSDYIHKLNKSSTMPVRKVNFEGEPAVQLGSFRSQKTDLGDVKVALADDGESQGSQRETDKSFRFDSPQNP